MALCICNADSLSNHRICRICFGVVLMCRHIADKAVGDGNISFEFIMTNIGDVLLGIFIFGVVCEQAFIDALYLAFGEDSGLELIDYSGNLISVYYW